MEIVSGNATGWDAWSTVQAVTARKRYQVHGARMQRDKADNDKRLEEKAKARLADLEGHSLHTDPAVLDKKRSVIEAALARARAKRADSGNKLT
jgi:electron transport complex protein RnfB